MKQLYLFGFTMLLWCASCVQNASDKTRLPENKPMNTLPIAPSEKDYTCTIRVPENPEKVFGLIQQFRLWWSEEIEGPTDQLNATFFYHYKDVHRCRLKLITKEPDKKLEYLVTENHFSFVEDITEWVRTRLVFEIIPDGDSTQIRFTHVGLIPENACYAVCNDAWTSYIKGSLYSLITTGKGKPNPREGGLNAELVEKWGLPDK